MKEKRTNVYFYVPRQVTILDLTGVVQVFEEAINLGFNYELQFIGSHSNIKSSSGIELSALKDFRQTDTSKNDIVFIFGPSTRKIKNSEEDKTFYDWLLKTKAIGATICSVCSGAFLLAESGLLNNKQCTIHWDLIQRMKTDFPHVSIDENTLFTKSDNIYTCAGVVTGIDLALFLIEERHGKQVATEVAKELVVYKRRLATDEQVSVYVQNRNHRDEKIHAVQDWMIQNLDKSSTIEELADMVFVSPRNLTRTFKKQTGITIAEYRTKLRVEKAKSLLSYSDYKVEHIANLCGYKTSKQLRMVLEKHLEALPGEIKNKLS
ncbi:GlxA family transcriptional regulator [Marinifilum caeruleilacunae]|uniref:Helix-turn-helix domain-containing protein n=1 Tax=Marinifilum caeruleilacunae TaxID=2499076 RepID=A0ABX1X150_9BACT|nr:helix-turn-helix domain-containing protein [Marinifilum caeruleilacunae]NOU62012.1 helix-turn-helix domain-containing protein [Marinifilum caeruleilacunae]